MTVGFPLQGRQPVHGGFAVAIEDCTAWVYRFDDSITGEFTDFGIVECPISSVPNKGISTALAIHSLDPSGA